jgi:hypothetical protein
MLVMLGMISKICVISEQWKLFIALLIGVHSRTCIPICINLC